MTTPDITCETFTQRLMDFLEGDLDGAARAGQERHAQGCRECGALLADLQRVSAQAAGLPALAPSRELWSGIAARIGTGVVPMPVRHGAWRTRVLTGIAVAATFAGAAILGYETSHHATSVPGASASGPLPSQPAGTVARASRSRTPAARLAAATPAAVEATYDGEISRLREVIDARRSRLDPKTIGVIDRNMKVIDDAIAACKAALAQDPASRFLIESLDQSLGEKVQFLRTAATLPTRS